MKNYKEAYTQYLKELSSSTLPKMASGDMRYYLELMQARLESLGLEIKRTYKGDGNVHSYHSMEQSHC